MNNLLPNVIHKKSLLNHLKKHQLAAGILLLIIILICYFYYYKRTEKSLVRVETINGITFIYDKDIKEAGSLHTRVKSIYQKMKEKFGPPTYIGEILIKSNNQNSFSTITRKLFHRNIYTISFF